MLQVVRRAKGIQRGIAAKNKELMQQNEDLQKENHDLHLQQLLNQQKLIALEE